MPISDELWSEIAPVVAGDMKRTEEQVESLRHAVEAMLESDPLDPWSLPPEVRSVSLRWEQNGTANRIRQKAIDAGQHDGPNPAPTQYSRPAGPEPHWPSSDREMMNRVQEWANTLHYMVHTSGDPDQIRVGREYLPAFHKALNLLYIWYGDSAAGEEWPFHPTLMPIEPDQWVDDTDKSAAIRMLSEYLTDAVEDVQWDANTLARAATNRPAGSKWHPATDAAIANATRNVQAQLDGLQRSIQDLIAAAERAERDATDDAFNAATGQTQRIGRAPAWSWQKTEAACIAWAQQHNGEVETAALAQSLAETQLSHRPVQSIRVSLHNAMRSSKRFRQDQPGRHRLVGHNSDATERHEDPQHLPGSPPPSPEPTTTDRPRTRNPQEESLDDQDQEQNQQKPEGQEG